MQDIFWIIFSKNAFGASYVGIQKNQPDTPGIMTTACISTTWAH